MSAEAWELIFMMFVLKLPIAYLIGVVWWAIRAAPDPYEPATLVPAEPGPEPMRPCTWREHHRRRPPNRPNPRTRVARATVRA
jgi:hypothetical protein